MATPNPTWNTEYRDNYFGERKRSRVTLEEDQEFVVFPGTSRFEVGIIPRRGNHAYFVYSTQDGVRFCDNAQRILNNRGLILEAIKGAKQIELATLAFDELESTLDAGITPRGCGEME